MQAGKEIVRRIPSLTEATMSWLDQYQKGKLVVEVDASDLSREMRRIGTVAQLVAAAAIIAGTVVASGIVLAAVLSSGYEGTLFVPVSALLGALFVLLLIGGLLVAYRQLRSVARQMDEGDRRR